MNKNLQIGWGRRSLNPGRPVAIPGQFHMRVSQGELNPVTVSALAIDNGEDSVIFASADIVVCRGGIFDAVIAKLAEIAPEVPVEKIVLNATHTHTGPGFDVGVLTVAAVSPEALVALGLGSSPSGGAAGIDVMTEQETRDFIAGRIAEAIAEAWKNRAPGQVAYGYGFATVGHSRRVIYLDDVSKRPEALAKPGVAVNGHGVMYGNTNDKMFSHYEAGADSFINLMYTFDMAGKLTGAIINVPCPAQTGELLWMLHAGFWHPVREKLRAKYGDIGLICQSAAGGDLAPRQLHYLDAELRRYKLKYPEKYAYLNAHPFPYPEGFLKTPEVADRRRKQDMLDMLRAEDIGERIAAAFDEVLEWAGKEKLSTPEFKHEVKDVMLDRRLFPDDIYNAEKANYEALMKKRFVNTGKIWADLRENSILFSARNRCLNVMKVHDNEQTDRQLKTSVHAVRIGDAAFVSNRFELFIDYMHRIQARSPFVQTFIVQLVADRGLEGGSYLATERAIANKGYSASPYCNRVSPSGGQQLVENTLEMLNEIGKRQQSRS